MGVWALRQFPDVLVSILLKREHFYKDQIECICGKYFSLIMLRTIGRKRDPTEAKEEKPIQGLSSLSFRQLYLLPVWGNQIKLFYFTCCRRSCP